MGYKQIGKDDSTCGMPSIFHWYVVQSVSRIQIAYACVRTRDRYAQRLKNGILRPLGHWIVVESKVCGPQFGLGKGAET